MANDYITQLPGELNIEMTEDNDLVFAINWDKDLTDYTFTANIVPKSCDTEIPMGIQITSASSGTMNVVISASSIADIVPSTNRWYMNWETPSPESYLRTVLAGAFVVRSK